MKDVMNCKVDANFDKKKTIFENVYSMYDSLFEKNIPIHKAVSKFIFSSCGGINEIIKKKNASKKLPVKTPSQTHNHRYSSKIQKVKKRPVVETEHIKKTLEEDKILFNPIMKRLINFHIK